MAQSMIARRVTYRKRKAVRLENDRIRCSILLGGGHLGEFYCRQTRMNPLWAPPWPTMEPWQYSPKKNKRRHGAHQESRLLAAILGHNFCADFFGEPSEDETRAGVSVHGESGVSRWQVRDLRKTAASASVTIGVELPLSRLAVRRKLTIRKNSPVLSGAVRIRNLNRLDHPFTFNEHVTVGPPFLARGVTVFDMPADWGHTLQTDAGGVNRLALGKPFRWPYAPGARKKRIDLRIASDERENSDFSTQQVAKGRTYAYLTALNPRIGLLLGYLWRRDVCPWIGSWEENGSRCDPPWSRTTQSRGLEFGNTPWPVSKRQAVDLGRLRGDKTFGWVPARGEFRYNFAAFLVPVPKTWRGVEKIEHRRRDVTVVGRGTRVEPIELRLGTEL